MMFRLEDKLAGAHIVDLQCSFKHAVEYARSLCRNDWDKIVIWHESKKVAEIARNKSFSWVARSWEWLLYMDA